MIDAPLAHAAHAVALAAVPLLGSREVAVEEFPFLADVLDDRVPSPGFAPLDRLIAAAGLGDDARRIWLAVALPEDDARFGVLYEALQTSPGTHRLTVGGLGRLWPSARSGVRALVRLGLLRITNPDAPRADAVLEVPSALWDAVADGVAPPWAQLRTDLPELADLHLPETLRERCSSLPEGPSALVVRGPRRNGRGTLLGAIARRSGRTVLEVELPTTPDPRDDPRVALAGPIATALNAMLVLRLEPAPGQAVSLPWPSAYRGHVGVVLPRQGGLDGAIARSTVVLRREIPDLDLRTAQWAAVTSDAGTFARRFRLSSGLIAAAIRQTGADLTVDRVREATRTLHREVLDQLATPIPVDGGWEDLVVTGDVERDLRDVERRCRHREHLPSKVGPALRRLSPGVRALFAGPSGTGKTLAARTLAAVLGMDLYRLDLGSVVDKYIGETEKNLERVFSRAEQLDVVLLLDEGDALMTRRTAVSSAHDRYANLETNFLLQRLESYDGIVLVTTNAAERIDSVFARRMDVVVEFHAPDIPERAELWALHLPAHRIPPAVLAEVAELARLTGAQIRNAAIHATLLALDEGRPVSAADLFAAVDREHRKMGAPVLFSADRRGA